MKRVRKPFMLTTLAAVAGCAASGGPGDFGTPAVHELARLQAMGELDQARVSCAVEALPPVTEALAARLPELRAARKAVTANATRDHARSVQQGMRASEYTDAALKASVRYSRNAQFLDARGDWTDAAHQRSYAMDLLEYAHAQGDISVLGSRDGEPWSDEEASLLVEYATLRSRRAAAAEPTSDLLDRIREVEADHPQVMNEYAALLIGIYRDPSLPCGDVR